MRERRFSPQRAVESLLFIAKRVQQPTLHEVLKIRYFADKLHFARFGFMASGDDYCAMEYGPVASNSYNLLKAARGERSPWIHPDFIRAVEGNLAVHGGKYVRALRDANLDVLAPSDVLCLEEAVGKWGNMDFDSRTQLSHDAAYNVAWAHAQREQIEAWEMPIDAIARTLENSEEVLEHLQA